MKNNNIVITIGRQFGSGGRELGRLLSKRLGYQFYDKELLLEAAKKLISARNSSRIQTNVSPGFLAEPCHLPWDAIRTQYFPGHRQ